MTLAGGLREGERDLETALHPRQGRVRCRLRCVLAHQLPTDPTPSGSDPGPEEPEEVVDFGGSANGGPTGNRGIALLDRHRGRQPLENVDRRLGHSFEELLGVR